MQASGASKIKLKHWIIAALCVLFTVGAFADAPQSVSTDTIINVPLGDAWSLFTTEPGLNSLGYAQAQIELRLGGRLHAADGGKLGGMDAEISSFEPERMLALKHDDSTWAVLYFQAMGKEMTGLRWVEFAPATQAQSLDSLAHAHRALFDQLVRRFAPECELCKKEKAAAANQH